MDYHTSATKRRPSVLFLFAAMIVARLSCVALSNIPVFTMTFTFMYGVGFFVIFLVSVRHVSRREFGILALALLYALYVVCQLLYVGKSIFSTDSFNAYCLVFILTIYIWSKRQPDSVRHVLLKIMFGGIMFTYMYSIFILLRDPNASRVVATAQRSPLDIISAVGGFEEVYGGVYAFCILLFFVRLMKGRRNKWKAAGVGLMCLAGVFIVLASYATAILLLLLGVVMYFSSDNKYATILMITVAVIALVFHEPVGQWIMDASERITFSQMLQKRVFNIGEMYKTFEATGTYGGEGGRLNRMAISWQAFLNHPIFGGTMWQDARTGGHSEFLDILGKYGLVGMGILITLFGNIYKDLQVGLQNEDMKKCCRTVFLLYIMTAVVNPALFAGQVLPILLILPLMPAAIADNDRRERNN